MRPVSWSTRAYNSASDSENRIHSDDVARDYGFRGGLVPGVTVYAYLTHPGIVAWGRDWLERGEAELELRRPVYDGDPVVVEVEPRGEHAYEAVVLDSSRTRCATARVRLPARSEAAPRPLGLPPCPAPDARPEATRDALEALARDGLGALLLRFDPGGEMRSYTADPSEMAAEVRPEAGVANPAFTLGLANWVLASNVRLGPWIHAASRARHLAPIRAGQQLVVEARVLDLFERREHAFVDLEVNAFLDGREPALAAWHRAIYRPARVRERASGGA